MSFSAYVPGDDWGRVCDVCGRLRPGKGFRTVENVWICDRHPSYVPRQVLDRIPYHDLGAPRPVPGAKPFNPIDTYEMAEAQILGLMTYAPAATLVVTNGAPAAPTAATVQAAAWAALYLADIIIDARRPARWVTYARALLGSLADWLVTNLAGGTNIDLKWGAYNRSTTGGEDYNAEDSGAAGLALLRAYQILGSAGYLTAARACAWFLRSCQCGDLLVSRPSSTDSAGVSPRHFGMWTSRVLLTAGTYDFSHRYYPSDLIGLEFLAAFKAAVGDEIIGSTSTAAVFNASRAALVSVAIAEALAFWTTPVFSVDDAALIAGFTAATPRESFNAYPTNKGGVGGGSGSWELQNGPLSTGTRITALSWAVGMRALRAVSGEAAVTATFDWLMTFTSNATTEPVVVSRLYGTSPWITNNDRATYAGQAGVYNPKLAPATLLTVRGTGAPQNNSSHYDLAAAGLLAALYSSRQPSAFLSLKDSLAVPKPRWREGFEPRDGQYLYLGPLGTCGLGLQPYTGTISRSQDVKRAAMTAGVYRYAPQAYTGRGH